MQYFGIKEATILAKSVSEGRYKFNPVKRTWIPKPGKKKKRPIDVPTQADHIHTICSAMEIPGNLYNKIQKQDLKRQFTMEEQAWLSDFQSDNENCPTELRELILETLKKKMKTQRSTRKNDNKLT